MVDYSIAPINIRPVDLGNALLGAAQIKAARQGGDLNALRMKQAQREESDNALMRQHGAAALKGDPAAMDALAQSPDQWLKVRDHISKMKQQDRDDLKIKTDRRARALVYADTPQKWDEAVTMLGKEDPEVAGLVGQFSPGRREFYLNQARSLADMLEKPKLMNVAPGGTVFDESTKRPIYTAPERPEKPGKVTQSDRVMGLAARIARGQATPEERREYDLLIRTSPFDRFMQGAMEDEEQGAAAPGGAAAAAPATAPAPRNIGPVPLPPIPASGQRPRSKPGAAGGGAQAVPRDPAGRIDRAQLTEGGLYGGAGGTVWRYESGRMVRVQ